MPQGLKLATLVDFGAQVTFPVPTEIERLGKVQVPALADHQEIFFLGGYFAGLPEPCRT